MIIRKGIKDMPYLKKLAKHFRKINRKKGQPLQQPPKPPIDQLYSTCARGVMLSPN